MNVLSNAELLCLNFNIRTELYVRLKIKMYYFIEEDYVEKFDMIYVIVGLLDGEVLINQVALHIWLLNIIHNKRLMIIYKKDVNYSQSCFKIRRCKAKYLKLFKQRLETSLYYTLEEKNNKLIKLKNR